MWCTSIKHRKRIVTCCCLFLIIIFILCYRYFDRTPDYTYGDDYYYTEIVDDITTQYPEYNIADSEERIGILRNYVYRAALCAYNQDVYVDVYDDRIYSDHFSEYVYNLLNLYNNGEPIGGFYCGGTNYALASLYKLLGYDALTVDLAVLDEGTVVESHVVALVELNNRWIVEDAYFNVEYRDANNKLLDISSLLNYLDNKQDEQIMVIDDSDIGKTCLSKEKIDQNEFTYLVENIRSTQNGYYVFDTEMSLKAEPFKILYPYFDEDGYKENQIYIFEYPYAVYISFFDIRTLWDYFTVKYCILGI